MKIITALFHWFDDDTVSYEPMEQRTLTPVQSVIAIIAIAGFIALYAWAGTTTFPY